MWEPVAGTEADACVQEVLLCPETTEGALERQGMPGRGEPVLGRINEDLIYSDPWEPQQLTQRAVGQNFIFRRAFLRVVDFFRR